MFTKSLELTTHDLFTQEEDACEKRSEILLTTTKNMNHELVMPKKYVDLSEEEMGYDGGWFWSAAIAIVGFAVTGAGYITNNETVKTIGLMTMVIGVASTGIGVGLAMSTLATSTSTAAVTAAGNTLAVEATLGAASNTVGFVSALNDAKKK